MSLQTRLRADAADIHANAVKSLFTLFEDLCDGALAVDGDARIVWINDKYRSLLGLGERERTMGRPVEEVIPNSLMRRVVESGRPILLDLMQFGSDWFVVTRLPLRNESDVVIGAIGFVLFDKLDRLKPLVSKFESLQRELEAIQRQLSEHRRTRYTFSQFIGSSAPALEAKRLARRAAQLDTTVLLVGETGTGKELLAQAIHAASRRANDAFVGVNVAAVPENLLEAEFFGVAPGAYTGADRKGRDGKFKLAHGGTLFLDEIGDMPIHLQAKLLRALQEQEIEPLGSNKVQKLDVRVIAATSRDLGQLVADGRFRSDLFFRLNVLPITIPPLRDRLTDLQAICEMLLEQIAARTGSPQRELDPSVYNVLAQHDWPGNVRELRNVLERTGMLNDRLVLTPSDFADIGLANRPNGRRRGEVARPCQLRPLADAIADLEHSSILRALEATSGRKAAAARMLGISRSTLYEKLAAYDDLSEFRT